MLKALLLHSGGYSSNVYLNNYEQLRKLNDLSIGTFELRLQLDLSAKSSRLLLESDCGNLIRRLYDLCDPGHSIPQR